MKRKTAAEALLFERGFVRVDEPLDDLEGGACVAYFVERQAPHSVLDLGILR